MVLPFCCRPLYCFHFRICTRFITVFENFVCFISAPGAWLSCSSRLDVRTASLLDVIWANKWLIIDWLNLHIDGHWWLPRTFQSCRAISCWNLPSSWRMSSQCLWVLTCEYSPMVAAHPRPQMVQLWDCEVTSTPAFLLSLFSCRSEMPQRRWRSKLDRPIPVAQERLHSERSWAVV